MFYSQFILAKKGPLGTIWIAAHLERKLRKNQVADTDIGVSVDSILSPDVPIALRLSSHLLVGVVRIYSRKVNYLFDDCSEALLKIKQAFRSTAVDLPPEESTAPYHSITLPETFDLDDFELPDNDLLQGNYVDHHISSKEQITLQDTMDGVTYSTSQFGLDERFGDGDTSGLDLDEELFLSKVAAAGHDDLMFNSSTDPQSSVQPMTSFNHEETNETTNSEIMTSSANKEIEEIDDGTDHMEYDQAPRTPGLLEEPNLPNIQETSACDDHLEFEHQNLTESAVKENMENASSNSNLYLVNGSLSSGVGPVPVHPNSDKDKSFLANGLESSQKIPQGELSTVESLLIAKPDSISMMSPASATEVGEISMNNGSFDKICTVPSILIGDEDMQNGTISNNEPHISFDDRTSEDRLNIQGVGAGEINISTCNLNNTGQPVSEAVLKNNGTFYQTESPNNVEIAEDLVQSSLLGNSFKSNAESTATSELEKSETQGRTEELNKMLELGNSVQENVACTENKNQIEASVSPNLLEREDDPVSAKSTVVQGEEFHEDDGSNQVVELVSCDKLNGQAENVNIVDGHLEIINSSTCSEFPAPEKLLSVPEMDTHNSLSIGATPGQLALTEGGNDTDATVTGKKRSFAESQLTMQSLNSVNSSAIVRHRTTPESVPGDDDLLSSILVGRKSLAFKVKETPQQGLPYLKRHKSAPRASASKRKVLMDEQMVLHGDMIRQQLTNTEDIRRLRKKAPCTRPDISMIQKQSLEDDMFSEPIFTGVSPGLASLHNQAYDLSETRISLDDVTINNASSLQDKAGTSFEVAKDMDLYEEFDSRVAGIGRESDILDGRVNYKAQPSEAPVLVESNHLDGQSVSLDPTFDVAGTNNLQDMHPETIEMDVDAVNPDANGAFYSSSTVDVMSNGTGDQTASVLHFGTGDQTASVLHPAAGITNEVDVTLQIEAPVETTDQQPDVLSVEIDVNAADKKDHNVDRDIVHDVHATEEISSRQMEIYDSVQVETEFHTEGVAHTESVYPTTMSVDMGARGSYNLSDEHAVDELRQNEQALLEEDMFLYAAADFNVNNLETGGVYDVENITNSLDPVMVDVDFGNSIHKENTKEFETDQVDYNNLDYSAAGNDTEFLNYDEDEVAEADEEDAPNAEETRFIDNSGWSSRTRAVAKYLQIMFDKEAERNQNVLPIDNLLVGKSRKEASRMFFETLVLKTKDYIHVEQTTPFNNINILPRAKLTKVDF
ncbi:Sister chromatid cohesion 1 protein 4 [Heracleum sosnowskyi]|uniref:Sister chromatid cohesion 1 protein 4 n=1 Tax=Heracleum sosnowskyi TaxID=360622 RepID=A0AAD8JET1_9APIA|nr:Sister chromatid cohesion 1 protein 4 [Heracleum sosnowskyi]